MLISYLLAMFACLLAIPAMVFFVEVIAAVIHRNGAAPTGDAARLRVAVLVPAHNEGAGLLPTVADIRAQLRAGDRILVVADNCSDDTAAVATAAGAEVVERHDHIRIGKGYALDFGLQHLGADPPDIVVMIDADCRVSDGTIDRLAMTCAAARRPAQALYTMSAPVDSSVSHQVAEFAWRVKNWVRPLGLDALNLPCQLMGTGMAFPWEVIRSAKLASGALVEDVKLGLDLASTGTPALFCPSARVSSQFPTSSQGAASQRQRWEQGHFGMIAAVPRLLWTAVLRGNPGLLVLALDMAVPPLSALGLLIVGTMLIAAWAFIAGASSAALIASTAAFLCFVLAVALSWLMFGRDILPPRAAYLILLYAMKKVPFYGRILSGRMATEWVRTDRSKPN